MLPSFTSCSFSDRDKNGDGFVANKAKDGNQAKAIERKEHLILELEDPQRIDEGSITRTRAKKMKEMLIGLSEDVRTKIAVEADLEKNKTCTINQ